MHLRYSYVKLDKNSLSLSANSKASFLGESFLGKKKKKKITDHLNYYPTSIRHIIPSLVKVLTNFGETGSPSALLLPTAEEGENGIRLQTQTYDT